MATLILASNAIFFCLRSDFVCVCVFVWLCMPKHDDSFVHVTKPLKTMTQATYTLGMLHQFHITDY